MFFACAGPGSRIQMITTSDILSVLVPTVDLTVNHLVGVSFSRCQKAVIHEGFYTEVPNIEAAQL